MAHRLCDLPLILYPFPSLPCLCVFSGRLQAERAAGPEPRHLFLRDRQRQGDAGHLVVDT